MRQPEQTPKLSQFLVLAGLCLNSILPSTASAQPGEAGTSNSSKTAAEALPPKAPDIQQTHTGKYIKQMAVMDTAKPDLPATKPKVTTKPINNDVDLLDSLNQPCWDSPPTVRLSANNNMLLGPDGKAISDVQGKTSSVLEEYKCTSVTIRRYKRADMNCEVDIFRFASSDGAYGAYSTMRTGSSTVVLRGQGCSEDESSITFFSGNALVYLHSVAEGEDEAKAMLGHLADAIAKYLPSGPNAPRLVASLPYIDKVSGSEKYFMGSQAAMRYGNVQFSEALLLDQSRGAACADYQYSRPMAERLKLMWAEYPTQAGAKNAFNTYASTMTSYARKTLDKTDSQIVCKMSGSFLMCGTMGARVFVISGAHRATSPSVLARELVPGSF